MILWLTTIFAFIIGSVNCQIQGLNETESQRVQVLAMEAARLALSQRVACRNPVCKTEFSASDSLNTQEGCEELVAFNEYASYLWNSIFPEHLDPEDPLRQVYDVSYWDYIYVFLSLFEHHLEYGFVRLWPRYYYDPSDRERPIHLLPEVIWLQPLELRPNTSNALDDLGPSDPDYHHSYPYDLPSTINRIKPMKLAQNWKKWVPETPQNLQNSSLYQLDHIIPQTLVLRFLDLYFPIIVEATKNDKSRVRTAVAKDAIRLTLGRKLSDSDSDSDTVKNLKDLYSNEACFDFHSRKEVSWAPGNLFYGFKKRAKSNDANGKFETRSIIITGEERFRRIEDVYNRMLDFTNRVGYTDSLRRIVLHDRQVILNGIRQNILSDSSLMREMTEIFRDFVFIAFERDHPYPNDWRQWEFDDNTQEWSIRSELEYEKFLESLRKNPRDKDDDDDNASGPGNLSSMLEGACKISYERVARKKRFVTINKGKKNKFQNFLVQNILNNRSDTVSVLQEYRRKFPDHNSTTLPELDKFMRHELSIRLCTDKDWICSKRDAICNHLYGAITLTSDDPEPVIVAIPTRGLFSHTSFPDWCNGKRYKIQNRITTDSAFVRIMTFNTTGPNVLNKQIYDDLRKDYVKTTKLYKNGFFLAFIDDELLKPASKASQILDQACKKYQRKSSSKADKNYKLITLPIRDPRDKTMREWCHEWGYIINPFNLYSCLVMGNLY